MDHIEPSIFWFYAVEYGVGHHYTCPDMPVGDSPGWYWLAMSPGCPSGAERYRLSHQQTDPCASPMCAQPCIGWAVCRFFGTYERFYCWCQQHQPPNIGVRIYSARQTISLPVGLWPSEISWFNEFQIVYSNFNLSGNFNCRRKVRMIVADQSMCNGNIHCNTFVKDDLFSI